MLTRYNALKATCVEDNMVISEYSIRSEFAARLASAKHLCLLIHQTPFYILPYMKK
jgi:hypothetical protein